MGFFANRQSFSVSVPEAALKNLPSLPRTAAPVQPVLLRVPAELVPSVIPGFGLLSRVGTR